MQKVTCRLKEHIQPFERKLALQELNALTGGPVVPLDGDYESALIFSTTRPPDVGALRAALAYWHSVGDATEGLTTQLRGEATLQIARTHCRIGRTPGNVSDLVPFNLPNRRSLRYATHGLHEYRGKFFPQLVRALMNIAQLPDDAIIMDPMCGSGTTLVEARLSARRSYGLDINPLSVFVTGVKCRTLSLAPESLTQAYSELAKTSRAPVSSLGEPTRFASLTEGDQTYFERWFSPQMVVELDCIEAMISRLPTKPIQDFYRVVLSNILRKISWQKNDDLRVRKQKKEVGPGDAIRLFLTEAARSTQTVAAFLQERGPMATGDYNVSEADARQAIKVFPELRGKVDAVITSPPYATALPYIDTDRLSLIYLGLLPRSQHRLRESLMIGNREVTLRGRDEYWAHYERNRHLLPDDTRALIECIDLLNKEHSVGFRRKNLSAVLSKYFFDMLEVIQQMFTLLRPGGVMFMVVGNNRTTAGGRPIEIATAHLLEGVARSVGFQLSENISMDMLVSRDIFKKNSVRSEQILRLEKPQ